ncbi:unnamed protein product [Choristocarpus tenellus]
MISGGFQAILGVADGALLATTGFSGGNIVLGVYMLGKGGLVPAVWIGSTSVAILASIQAVLLRKTINWRLVLHAVPFCLAGVVVGERSIVSVVMVPVFGVCLVSYTMILLFLEVEGFRRRQIGARYELWNKRSANEDRGGANEGFNWKAKGLLWLTSLFSGLLSSCCPPPGPAFIALLLSKDEAQRSPGWGEWRATAAVVASTGSFLTAVLFYLEHNAPISELGLAATGLQTVSGLTALLAVNAITRRNCPFSIKPEHRREPPPFPFRWTLLALALLSSTAMIGRAPNPLTYYARVFSLTVLGLSSLVVLLGWAVSLMHMLCGKGTVSGGGGGGGGGGNENGFTALTAEDQLELQPFTEPSLDQEEWGEDRFIDTEDSYFMDGENYRGQGSKGGGIDDYQGVHTGGVNEENGESPMFPEGHTVEL